MPVTWQFRSPLLTLVVSGVVTNPDIEQAVGDALATASSQSGIRLLWDARGYDSDGWGADGQPPEGRIA